MTQKGKCLVLCVAACALAVTAAAQSTWKLSKDLVATNNQISFSQGSNGVWYFLRSNSLAHLPRTYEFLAAYYNPCVSDSASHFVDGMACWQNPNPEGVYLIPLVGINANYQTKIVKNIAFPPRSVFMHPSNAELAVIGWKSPIAGLVHISGFFSDLDPTGATGIIWSIYNGSARLASGTVSNGGPPQTFDLDVAVKVGEVLYFAVDPDQQNDSSDSTGVDIVINTQ
jgi:hypothetical protein